LLRPYLRRKATAHIETELRWLAGLLGDVRDTQVLRKHLSGAADALDPDSEADRAELDDRLRAQCEFRRAPLLSALSGDRYLELLTTLWAFAGDPPLRRSAPADARALPLIRRRARRAWARVRRTVRKLGSAPTDVELHSLRKRIKGSRYAAQTARLVGAPAKEFIRRLGELQDELGDLHDSVVAMAWLEDEGSLVTPSAAFLAGRLHHEADERRRALRESWRVTWAEADRLELREWMH
jgi:CHAD domain-containing protein